MTDKVNALAAKITKTAEDGLVGIERMMTAWPAEYRAIVWGAVADIANNRRVAAEMQHRASE